MRFHFWWIDPAMIERMQFLSMVDKIFIDKFWISFNMLPENIINAIDREDNSEKERERCWDMRTHIDVIFDWKWIWCVVSPVHWDKQRMILDYTH